MRTAMISLFTVLALGAVALAGGEDKPRPLLADRHKAAGLACTDCHGEGSRQAVESDQCLSCHESWEATAKRTRAIKPNPHDNHVVNASGECNLCHHGHKAAEVVCAQCHQDFPFRP